MRRSLLSFLALASTGGPVLAEDALQDALDKLRRMRAEGVTRLHTIEIPPGRYFHSLTFDAELVGEGLTLRARDHSENSVVISAGIPITGWNTEGKFWTAKADVPDVLQFFINDLPRPRCRTPDKGYFRIEQSGPDRRTSFTWQSGNVPPVKDLAHTELLFLHDWSISRVPVKSLDPATRTLTTTFPVGPPAPHYAIDHYEKQPRYALEGALDFLDTPGEWHFDRKTRTLHYYAKPGEIAAALDATIPAKSHVLTLAGTAEAPLKKLRLENLTFAHAHFQPPSQGYAAGQATGHDNRPNKGRVFVSCAVQANFCEDLVVRQCIFRNCSGGGLWLREGCTNAIILNSTFRELGGNGLMIGQPETPQHTTTNVTAQSCLIERCGTRYFGAVGIWIGMAEGCTVRKCEVRDLPYTGISVGWRWNPKPSACKGHLIDDNHIHHILNQLSDGGGIYTLGYQPGTTLRDNHIHDVSLNAGRSESNGIFMDEGTTGFLVEGNHIHDIARSPIRFHQAGRNLLRKNKLRPADDTPPLRFNSTPEINITIEDPQ